MKLIEYTLFLALMIPTFLLMAAAVVSLADLNTEGVGPASEVISVTYLHSVHEAGDE
jgi:hypothetical protein